MSVPHQELLHARGWDLPAGWGPLPSKDRFLLSYYYIWVHQLSFGTSPVLANHAWAPPRQSAGPWGRYWTQAWVWSLKKMHKGNSGAPSREPQERRPWPLVSWQASPPEFWRQGPDSGLELQPALTNGLPVETLKQLQQFVAHKIS